jgi:hypothetical protein
MIWHESELTPFEAAPVRISEVPMSTNKTSADVANGSLLTLRFEIPEAAQILRMSRAQLYNRIQSGTIRPQKDGARTYITRVELERYVDACD